MNQVEMDEQIQQEQGMTISRIFEEKGEEYFRKLETDLLKRLSLQSSTVVSCGGGTAMRECNVEIMKKKRKDRMALCRAGNSIRKSEGLP